MAKRKNRSISAKTNGDGSVRHPTGQPNEITFTETHYEGDYLPPEILNAYDPETRAWIKERVEVEQARRHEWAFNEQLNRKESSKDQARYVYRLVVGSQIHATIISVVGMLIGAFLIFHDKNVEGFIAFGTGIALIVGSAIWRRLPKKTAEGKESGGED